MSGLPYRFMMQGAVIRRKAQSCAFKGSAVFLVLWLAATGAGCRSPVPDARRSDPYRPDMPGEIREPRQAGQDTGDAPRADVREPADFEKVVEGGLRLRLLQPGDRLDVHLHGIPNPMELQAVVDEKGCITLPHIGQVEVAEKTSSEVGRLVERLYVEGEIYRSVTCVVIPPHIEFFVRGEIRQPGRFPLTRDITLMQAIALAGGYTEYAQTRRVSILRGSESIEVNVRNIERGQEESPPIKPGDIIVVPRRWW